MKSPRLSLAVASVAMAPLLLAGCEKPYPGVTAWSGTRSEHVQAACWQRDAAKVLGPTECAQEVLDRASAGEGVARIEVAPGDTVGVSVDPVVAESGWTLQIGGQTLATGITDTYYRFTFPEQGATEDAGYTMQVIAEAASGGSRGFWFFQLVPR